MAISVVGVFEGSNTNGANATVTLSGTATNDVVVVLGGNGDSGSGVSIVTSGYTELYNNSKTNCNLVAAYKRLAAPETSVVGFGGGDGHDAVCFVAIVLRGVHTSTAIDATTTDAGGTTGNPNSPSITTVTDGAYVISGFCHAGQDNTITAPTDYINQVDISQTEDDHPVFAGLATRAVSPAGAENPSGWSASVNDNWLAVSIAIRPAVAGLFNTGALSAGSIRGTASFVGSFTQVSLNALSATGKGTATFKGSGLVQRAVSMTGTNATAFVGTSFASFGRLTATGTITPVFTGFVSNSGGLEIAGTANVFFAGGSIVDAMMTAESTGTAAAFIGDITHMSSVRETIESKGAATVVVA